MTPAVSPVPAVIRPIVAGIAALLPASIRRNLLSMAALSAVSRGITFLTTVYVARAVGVSGFGLLTFGLALAAYGSILVGPGFLVWGVRATARDQRSAGRHLVAINGVQIVLALVAYAVLAGFAFAVLHGPQRLMVLAAGTTVFSIALSVDWVCQGLQRFRLLGAGQVVASVATLVATALLVHAPADVLRVPIIQVAALVLAAGGLTVYLRGSGAVLDLRADRNEIREVLVRSLPLGLSGAMVTVLHYFNSALLGYIAGPTVLGQFAAPFRLWEILTPVAILVSNVALPSLANLHDRERVVREFGATVRLVMTMAFLPAVFFALEPGPLVNLIYSDQFASAAALLPFFSIGVIFNFAAVIHIAGLLIINRDRVYIASIAAALVWSIIGGLLLVPRAGALGATLVVATLDLVTWLASMPAFRSALGTTFVVEWTRPALSALVAAVCLLGGQMLDVPFAVRAAAAILAFGFVTMLSMRLPARRS